MAIFNKLSESQQNQLKKLRDKKKYLEVMKLAWSFRNKSEKVIIVSFVAILLSLGILVDLADHQNIDPKNISVSASLYASQLADAYRSNEVSADNLYKNNWIQVTGYVHSVEKEIITETPYVNLYNDSGFDVRCYFNDPEDVSSLQMGQAITIIGLCKGKEVIYPVLKKCIIK